MNKYFLYEDVDLMPSGWYVKFEDIPQWVSVKDRLPDCANEVLTFNPEDASTLEKDGYFSTGFELDYYGYHFINAEGNRYDSFQSETVTHWMPLPWSPLLEGPKR